MLTRRTFALALASALATAVLLARILYTGHLTHLYLAWNLFLAWFPYIFAIAAWRLRQTKLLLWLPGMLWFLFFPNALYILTDFIHLRPGPVPLWYDATMLFIFAFVGFFLGLHSLRLMQQVVTLWWGRGHGLFFTTVALALGAVGVYVGRFLRWNSWDAILRPARLSSDLLNLLLRTDLLPQMAGFILLFGAVTTVTYLLVFLPEPPPRLSK